MAMEQREEDTGYTTDEVAVVNCWCMRSLKSLMLVMVEIAVTWGSLGGTSWIDEHPHRWETVRPIHSSAWPRSQGIPKRHPQKRCPPTASWISWSISLQNMLNECWIGLRNEWKAYHA